jgi:hypothetical protein
MGTFWRECFGAEAEERVGFKVAAWLFSLQQISQRTIRSEPSPIAPKFAI